MKKNVGLADTLIRVVAAIVIAILYFTHTISGTTATVAAIIAVVLFVTGIAGFCPLYLPFGISTKNKK